MKTFIMAAVLLCALHSAVLAQGGGSGNDKIFGIGPRLGYYKSGDAFEGGWYFGGQFRVHLMPFLGAEAALDYRASETFRFPANDGQSYTADVAYVPVTVSLLGMLPLGGITPYGLAGFGWYHTSVDYSSPFEAIPGGIFTDHTVSKFGYHIGLGAELNMNANAALTADYRYLFLKSDIQGPSDLINDDVTLDTKDSDGSVFTIGLMLYF